MVGICFSDGWAYFDVRLVNFSCIYYNAHLFKVCQFKRQEVYYSVWQYQSHFSFSISFKYSRTNASASVGLCKFSRNPANYSTCFSKWVHNNVLNYDAVWFNAAEWIIASKKQFPNGGTWIRLSLLFSSSWSSLSSLALILTFLPCFLIT